MAKFKVQQKTLARVLALTRSATETKTTVPILATVMIDASSEGIRITGTDLETAISTLIPGEVKAPGRICIAAKKLHEYVGLLSSDELEVDWPISLRAVVKCGRAKATFPGLDASNFPVVPEPPADLARIPLKSLVSMIERTRFAVSVAEDRYALKGCQFETSSEKMCMVATDGHRLSLLETTALEGFDEKLMIPTAALQAILRMADEPDGGEIVGFGKANNHMWFVRGGSIVTSRVMTGNFPDYTRILPKTFAGSVVLERKALADVLKRMNTMGDERSHAIKLSAGPNGITFFSSSVETGETEESMEAAYVGEPVEVGFNGKYILEFLANSSAPRVTFSLQAKGACQIADGENPEAPLDRYVVMPMRL